MKIFISWSGTKSGQLGKILYQWLPMVLQHVKPFISLEEVEKGARWSTTVAQELHQTNFGIVCLTPDNLKSRWLHFEAGAIARSMDQSRVAPILFGLTPSDVQGPLAQFQLTRFDREEFKKLIFSMNTVSGHLGLIETNLERVYDALWPQLEERASLIHIDKNPKTENHPAEHSSAQSILEEILQIVRYQTRLLSSDELGQQIAKRISRMAEQDLTDQSHTIETLSDQQNSVLYYISRYLLLSNIITRYVNLQKNRGHWSGLCPFHKETTPSFNVIDDKGFYHCFGCGAHGNSIEFVMNIENLTYDQAIRRIIVDFMPEHGLSDTNRS